jgi:hypothetical protein
VSDVGTAVSIDIYSLATEIPAFQPEHLHQPAPLVRWFRVIEPAILCTWISTDLGELALGHGCCRLHALEWLQLREDSI